MQIYVDGGVINNGTEWRRSMHHKPWSYVSWELRGNTSNCKGPISARKFHVTGEDVNLVEHKALVLGLMAVVGYREHIEIYTDSQTVYNNINGGTCNEKYLPLRDDAIQRMSTMDIRLVKVPRDTIEQVLGQW